MIGPSPPIRARQPGALAAFRAVQRGEPRADGLGWREPNGVSPLWPFGGRGDEHCYTINNRTNTMRNLVYVPEPRMKR